MIRKKEDKIIVNARNVRIRARARMRLFNILGGPECCKCGFSDIRALQFDHLNGNGRHERLTRQEIQGASLYFYYVKNSEEAIKNLQVLCANCNWIKRSEEKEYKSPSSYMVTNPYGWRGKGISYDAEYRKYKIGRGGRTEVNEKI